MHFLCLKKDPLRCIQWAKRMGHTPSMAAAEHWVKQVKFWGSNTDITYFRSSQRWWEACAITGRQVNPQSHKPRGWGYFFSFYLSLAMLWFKLPSIFSLLQLELQLVTSPTVIMRWGTDVFSGEWNWDKSTHVLGWGEKQFHKFKDNV